MKIQYTVMETNSGSLMGFPNAILTSPEAARASISWYSAEQSRKWQEHEDDPEDEVKEEAWSRVAGHDYCIKRREVGPWQDV